MSSGGLFAACVLGYAQMVCALAWVRPKAWTFDMRASCQVAMVRLAPAIPSLGSNLPPTTLEMP